MCTKNLLVPLLWERTWTLEPSGYGLLWVYLHSFSLLELMYVEVVYEKSIGTKMNDLNLCLEIVSRSCQPLRYTRRWISRKPLQIEAWFQRTTNRKFIWTIEWSRDRWHHVTPKRCCEAVRSTILATAWLLVYDPPIWQQTDGRTDGR